VLELFYRNVRTPWERRGDMDAQMAAAHIGERRLREIIARYGSRTVQAHAEALLAYSAQLTRVALSQLPEGEVSFTDYLDDDGWGVISLPIVVRIKVEKGNLEVDFTGTASQSTGCINAVQAVTHSAVLYVVRCLVGEHVPTNLGCLEPVRIHIPDGSLLNPNVQRTGNEIQLSNTRNTPIEVLEMEMPVRIRRYSLRHVTGGVGRFRGGDGLCRELMFLAPARVTLLTERRKYAPYGLFGGEPGALGINTLEREGKLTQLPGKVTFDVKVGDILSISTPGGGGYLVIEQEN
jgi:N-methylhydantoinase B/oxoprolinase/acetone carboxylase alpha subunit